MAPATEVLRFACEGPLLLGFSARVQVPEKVGCNVGGGGSATGIQRSLNL